MNKVMIKQVELFKQASRKDTFLLSCVLVDGLYEVMLLDDEYFDLEYIRVDDKDKALKSFDDIFYKCAGNIQKEVYDANLKQGGKYTICYINSTIGGIIWERITLDSVSYNTYAQYDDVVTLKYKGYKKRTLSEHAIYNKGILIYDGWIDLTQAIDDTLYYTEDKENIVIKKSKYLSFDKRQLETIKNILPIKPVVDMIR